MRSVGGVVGESESVGGGVGEVFGGREGVGEGEEGWRRSRFLVVRE